MKPTTSTEFAKNFVTIGGVSSCEFSDEVVVAFVFECLVEDENLEHGAHRLEGLLRVEDAEVVAEGAEEDDEGERDDPGPALPRRAARVEDVVAELAEEERACGAAGVVEELEDAADDERALLEGNEGVVQRE